MLEKYIMPILYMCSDVRAKFLFFLSNLHSISNSKVSVIVKFLSYPFSLDMFSSYSLLDLIETHQNYSYVLLNSYYINVSYHLYGALSDQNSLRTFIIHVLTFKFYR